MDKLLKLSQEHQEVFESLAFFKKAVEVTSGQGSFLDIPKLKKFFQEYVLAHFQYEESHIFPKVLSSNAGGAKQIVRQLQKEHIEICSALDRFSDLASRAGDCPTALMKKKIALVVKAAIKKIVLHARKEDDRFFPLVRKLGITL